MEAALMQGHSTCQTAVKQGRNALIPFSCFFFFSLPADAFHDYAKPKAFWQGSPAKLLVHRRGQRGTGKEAPVAVRDLTFLPVIRASKA